MADSIIYPKELGDVFDRALDKCYERVSAREEDSIAFLVLMNVEGEIVYLQGNLIQKQYMFAL